MDKANIYTVGGTVQAGGGIYLSRQADAELLTLCRQRIFAYVLTPRQMGKSSLMVRTAEKLAEEGIQSIIIDLTQLGVQVTAEQWYLGLLTIIADQLMLDRDVVGWWNSLSNIGITQRLTRFLKEILLAEVSTSVVIFIDEIDTTLSLNFTDDFFAAIRYLYNARANVPEFQRLSFVLIGVATPSDLIRDPKRTPFNIGQRVDLSDFNFDEAQPLANGLGLPTDEAQQVLRWVLKWTGGHPYLMQRLYSTMREQGKSSWSKADVDHTVNNTFFGAMSEQDNNLQFVRDMLTKRSLDIRSVLTTYREVHRGKHPVVDEEQSLVKSHLKLSGVVRSENSVLQVRNLIYRKVFDDIWIQEHLPIPPKVLTFKTVFLICVSVTALTLGIRELKGLQSWELSAYDQMLRLRPPEPPEPRILVVSITEEDIQRENWPLPDSTINRLLAKLESYQPRVIGLDIYRPKQKNFADGLPRNNIISICTFSSIGEEEIPPPPNFPTANVGFSDLVSDDDYVVRRSLLFARPALDKRCNSQFSFAALLAMSYLNKLGIEQHDINKNHNFQMGKTLFRTLRENSGGYEHLDAKGRQILLNYHDPHHFVNQATLTQVLTNQLDPNLFKDRLVIIGTTARSVNSGFYTPYSGLPDQPSRLPDQPSNLPVQPLRMPPVFIHAHIASQIISTVLDGRPLIWYWSNWAEGVWVLGWSLVGGVLVWQIRNPSRQGLAGGASLVVLTGVCYVLFLQAGWIPIIPPAVALVTSGVCVIAYTIYQIRSRGSA